MNQVLNRDLLDRMYYTMIRIRKTEETIGELVSKGEIITPCHLYIGQEAIATGICSTLEKDDWVFSNHRSHGHFIAQGGSLRSLFAELFGKKTGCSGGWGGSMHLSDPSCGFPGSSAIVAGSISVAVGAALGFSYSGTHRISTVFFGDGATNEGVFYEALNFAALFKLPVLFVCENNFYSAHMPISRCLANTDILNKAEAMGVKGMRIDGNDVIAVFNAANIGVVSIRNGEGPFFLECQTYRWRGHVGPNDDVDKGIRSAGELASWVARCPIKRMEGYLESQEVLTEKRRKDLQEHVSLEIHDALEYARNSSYPMLTKDTHNPVE